jgi:hypothetical protein
MRKYEALIRKIAMRASVTIRFFFCPRSLAGKEAMNIPYHNSPRIPGPKGPLIQGIWAFWTSAVLLTWKRAAD